MSSVWANHVRMTRPGWCACCGCSEYEPPDLFAVSEVVQQHWEPASAHDQRARAESTCPLPRLSQGVQKQVVLAQTLCQLPQRPGQTQDTGQYLLFHLVDDSLVYVLRRGWQDRLFWRWAGNFDLWLKAEFTVVIVILVVWDQKVWRVFCDNSWLMSSAYIEIQYCQNPQ